MFLRCILCWRVLEEDEFGRTICVVGIFYPCMRSVFKVRFCCLGERIMKSGKISLFVTLFLFLFVTSLTEAALMGT